MSTPPATFRITTYWKRARNEAGLTRMDSKRLTASQALDWVLRELPDEAWDIKRDDEDGVTLTIDWAKVPDEIRLGGLL